MIGFLDSLKRKILGTEQSANAEEEQKKPSCDEYLISLGVLLWVVAESDETFLPQEKNAIKKVLKSCSEINDKDMSIVLRAIEEAALFRIDLYAFTKELNRDLDYKGKVGIVENLFRVACSDKDLDNSELEIIRKIAGLIGVEHKEFIDAKIKVKKELGMDTSGL